VPCSVCQQPLSEGNRSGLCAKHFHADPAERAARALRIQLRWAANRPAALSGINARSPAYRMPEDRRAEYRHLRRSKKMSMTEALRVMGLEHLNPLLDNPARRV